MGVRPFGLLVPSLLAFGLAVAPFNGWTRAADGQTPRPPEDGGRVLSLGQPPKWRLEAGMSAGAFLPEADRHFTARVAGGAYRHLFNPVVGLPELGAEGYTGVRDGHVDAGLRAMMRVPFLGSGIGADFNIATGVLDMVVMFRSPVRRGGLLSRGSQLRLDWYPLRSQGFTLGITTPLSQPLAGRGRPLRDAVRVAGVYERPRPHVPRDTSVFEAIDSLRVSAHWIGRLVVPFLDQDARSGSHAQARTARTLDSMAARLATRGAEAEVRHWHATMERLFAVASGDPDVGRALAGQARKTMLRDILLPYDRLLGRKKQRDTLNEHIVVARGRFGRWVATSGLVPYQRTEDVLFAFQALTSLLEAERARSALTWDDPRLVWLPLQYALLPEDHDEQAEIDDLLEQATGTVLSDHNRIRYVANVQFLEELRAMIRETRDYQVLWIHDFPAVTAGRLDRAAVQTVVTYLTTLTERVRAYDSTHALPSYFIFLDQHYYEQRSSRLLMDVLEDPLSASGDLPHASDADREALDHALDGLAVAVRESRVLDAERREFGEAWVHNRIKVHVNITNRPDPSFWGGDLAGSLFGYADDVMRDHRKIAFRDVSEGDPFAGTGVLTGMGVGEQYLGPSWDDRSLLMRGPVLLDLRRAARTLLLDQGMRGDDMPPPLRERPRVGDATPPGNGGFDARAMVLFNSTGYGPKPLNVAKAILYTLMPGGSVFKIPDSLWNSTFFAGALLGSCLRGSHVLVVSPGLDNAPSSGFPQMARAHETFTRLLMARRILGPALQAVGGDLRTGLYALPVDANGFSSRAERWALQVDSTTFLGTLLPFVPAVMPAMVAAAGVAVHLAASDTLPPRLHQKVQFMASREFWTAVTASAEWPAFMATYLRYREATYSVEGQAAEARLLPDSLEAIAERMLAGARAGPRAAAYATVGSQNQDYRGMFMDGEVFAVLTGAEALVPLVDLVFLVGTVTWVDDQAALDRLIPPVSEWQRRVARFTKDGI